MLGENPAIECGELGDIDYGIPGEPALRGVQPHVTWCAREVGVGRDGRDNHRADAARVERVTLNNQNGATESRS